MAAARIRRSEMPHLKYTTLALLDTLLRRGAGLALCTIGLLSGCSSGGGGAAPAAVDVTGSWNGIWSSSFGPDTGTFVMTAAQDGATVSGSADLSGSTCFFGGGLAGSVSGSTLTGSLTAGANQAVFSLTVTGDTLNGSYSVTGGDCAGDSGSVTASRVSALLGEDDDPLPIEPRAVAWPVYEDDRTVILLVEPLDRPPVPGAQVRPVE